MQGENNLHNHQTGMCAAQNGLNALQLLPLFSTWNKSEAWWLKSQMSQYNFKIKGWQSFDSLPTILDLEALLITDNDT